MAKKKRPPRKRAGASYASKRGLHRFLAVKKWCKAQGMAVTDVTSSQDLYDFMVKKGLPEKYKSMSAKEVVREMGHNLMEREHPTTSEGKVYFITDGEYVKIGYAKNPDERLAKLQTANARILRLIGVIESATIKTERSLHSQFERQNQNGEWFRIEGDLLQYLVEQFNFRKGGG